MAKKRLITSVLGKDHKKVSGHEVNISCLETSVFTVGYFIQSLLIGLKQMADT